MNYATKNKVTLLILTIVPIAILVAIRMFVVAK